MIISEIRKKVLDGVGISQNEALKLASMDNNQLDSILELTDEVREKFFGEKIRKCTDGFTSNRCTGHCKFCYLNPDNFSKFTADRLPKVITSVKGFVEDAKEKEKRGATQYKIVGTECKLPEREFQLAVEAFKAIKTETKLGLCASMGFLSPKQLEILKDVGVEYFNHNIETTPKRFPSLGSIFSFEDKLKENEVAKEIGLKRCCGLIVGMGETIQDRIEVAFILRDKLNVESIPFNIYTPPKMDEKPQVEPEEALKTLAIFRLILPTTHIIVNNGNAYFGSLFKKVFAAGASGFGVRGGSYLTHARIKDGVKIVKSLGLD